MQKMACRDFLSKIKNNNTPIDTTVTFPGILNQRFTGGPCYAYPAFHKEMRAFAAVLSAGRCPEGTLVELPLGEIKSSSLQLITNALQTGQCPERFGVDFRNCFVDKKAILYLSEALQSDHCPTGLRLNFGEKNTYDSLVMLFESLKVGRCPKSLSLEIFVSGFNNRHISDSLISILSHENCPHNLTVTFADSAINRMDIEFVVMLIDYLKPSGKVQDLGIKFHSQIEWGRHEYMTNFGFTYGTIVVFPNDHDVYYYHNPAEKTLKNILDIHTQDAPLYVRQTNLIEPIFTLMASRPDMNSLVIDIGWCQLDSDVGNIISALRSKHIPEALVIKFEPENISYREFVELKSSLEVINKTKKCIIDVGSSLPQKLQTLVFFDKINGNNNYIIADIDVPAIAGEWLDSTLSQVELCYPHWFGVDTKKYDDNDLSDADFATIFEKLNYIYRSMLHAYPNDNIDIGKIIQCLLGFAESSYENLEDRRDNLQDYYTQLGEFVLPLFRIWQANLKNTPSQSIAFGKACHRLAMCYHTSTENEILRKTQRPEGKVSANGAQRSLALRLKLLHLSNKYDPKKHTRYAYDVGVSNLTASLSGRPIVFPPAQWEATKKSPAFLKARCFMLNAWLLQNRVHSFADGDIDSVEIFKYVLGYAENLHENLSSSDGDIQLYYEQLNGLVLPIFRAWHSTLGNLPDQGKIFGDACGRLAMCYHTATERAILRESQNSQNKMTIDHAQRSLALRAKLLQFNNQYGHLAQTSQAHQTCVSNLTSSLSGKPIMFPPMQWEATKKSQAYLKACRLILEVWFGENKVFDNQPTLVASVTERLGLFTAMDATVTPSGKAGKAGKGDMPLQRSSYS